MRSTFVELPALPSFLSSRLGAAFAVVALAAWTTGCTPKIGDSCFTSTDCSQRGDRLCDTAQPGGYCTLFNCRPNLCPDEASCVLFDPQIPGCGFDDRSGAGGSRIARSACMRACESDADCRDGYVCGDPRLPPWNALILDEDQGKRSCLVLPAGGFTAKSEVDASAPVCQPGAPDAGTIVIPSGDAGAGDAGVSDAGADAGDGG